MKKTIIAVGVAALAVFGLTVQLTRESYPSGASVILPDFSGLDAALRTWSTGVTHINTVANPVKLNVRFGPQAAEAASASDWTAVRQSATWANNNSNLADQIIMTLKNAGLLANSGTFTTTTVINGTSYKIKLQTGGSFNAGGVAATATNYSNKFQMWRASDNKVTLQLYFNDVGSPNAGVLLFYRLAILGPTTSNNEDLIVESYIFGSSPSRKQTYSWGQPFWTSGANAATTSVAGRVILEEMTIGLVGGGTSAGLCVKIVSRTTPISGCNGITGAHYYVLAYGQKTDSNFETTAKAGVHRTSVLTAVNSGNGGICAGGGLNYGLFNGGGFVEDGQASPPSGYPNPSAGGGYGGVHALFGELGTAGSGAWDDTQSTMLDTTLATIAFPDNSAPGF